MKNSVAFRLVIVHLGTTFIDYISSGCFLSDNIKIKIRINTIPMTWTDWKVTPSHNALVTTAITGSIVPNNVVSLGDKYLRLSINR